MKKTLTILSFIILCASMSAQDVNLKKMKKAERSTYLENLALEVAQNFFPDCYEIFYDKQVRPVIVEKKKMYQPDRPKFHGRDYYLVRLPCVYQLPGSKSVHKAIDVWILEDNGQPFTASNREQWGVGFHDRPYREWVEQGIKPEDQILLKQRLKPFTIEIIKECKPEFLEKLQREHPELLPEK